MAISGQNQIKILDRGRLMTDHVQGGVASLCSSYDANYGEDSYRHSKMISKCNTGSITKESGARSLRFVPVRRDGFSSKIIKWREFRGTHNSSPFYSRLVMVSPNLCCIDIHFIYLSWLKRGSGLLQLTWRRMVSSELCATVFEVEIRMVMRAIQGSLHFLCWLISY